MTRVSTPPHRTREERTADSRARILDAAVRCLVEDGYAAATTLRIQAMAGVSRGRLLHHFPSRDLLLVAAAQHLAAQRIQATEERVVELPDGRERVDRVVELMWATFHEPYFWAAVELWSASRTNPQLAEVLRPEERHLGRVVRAAVGHMFGEPHVVHPRFDQLRELLVTSMRGVSLTYSFDRRDPTRDPHVAEWQDLAHLLLDS